jgi:hypothetical protein
MQGSTIPSSYYLNISANSPYDPNAVGLGLAVVPNAGNIDAYAGMNLRTNFTLEQTVTAFAGRTYTLTAAVWMGSEYSGSVTELHQMSPSGSIASPTNTKLELAFLNSAFVVIGTPSEVDLRYYTTLFDYWEDHSFSAVAPVGTTRVRVRAIASNMTDNLGSQELMFDNFDLRDSVAPSIRRLTNGDLNLTILGDYNGNQFVDAADYVVWRNGGPLPNEVDEPGVVNQGDYAAWRARFGDTAIPAAGIGLAEVPEQINLLPLLIGLVVSARNRRVPLAPPVLFRHNLLR